MKVWVFIVRTDDREGDRIGGIYDSCLKAQEEQREFDGNCGLGAVSRVEEWEVY